MSIETQLSAIGKQIDAEQAMLIGGLQNELLLAKANGNDLRLQLDAARKEIAALKQGTPATEPSVPPVVVAGRPTVASTTPTGTLTKVDSTWEPKSGGRYKSLHIIGQRGFDGLTDIQFENCRWEAGKDVNGNANRYCARVNNAGIGIVFKRVEFTGMASCAVYGRNYSAIGCGIRYGLGDGFKATTNVLIQGCHVSMLGMSDGAHADGVQITTGSNVKIIGNVFDMPINVAGTKSNAALFAHESLKDISFCDNVCIGGNYTVQIMDSSANDATHTCTGNVISGWRYGPFRFSDGVKNVSGNVDDKGNALAA